MLALGLCAQLWHCTCSTAAEGSQHSVPSGSGVPSKPPAQPQGWAPPPLAVDVMWFLCGSGLVVITLGELLGWPGELASAGNL